MEESTIMIKGARDESLPNYEELIQLKGRVDAFAAYVRIYKYSVERETCAALLGFDLDGENNGRTQEL